MHLDHTGGGATPFPDEGMSASSTANGRARGHGSGARHLPALIAALLAENQELRAELECFKAERAHTADILNRLMAVLSTPSPERLVHDVRNVLNERELYRALADVSA